MNRMRWWTFAFLLVAAPMCRNGGNDGDDTLRSDDDDDTADDDDDTQEPFDFITCSLGCPGEEICNPDGSCRAPVYPVAVAGAEERPSYDGVTNRLINGRTITAKGPSLRLGTFPTNVEIHPSGAFLVVNENGHGTRQPDGRRRHVLRVVEAASMSVAQELVMPNGTMYWGLRFAPDGNRLYVAGGEDRRVHVYDVSPDNRLSIQRSIPVPGCHTTDLVLGADRLYVTCVLNDAITVVNLSDDAILAAWETGTRPYTAALDAGGERLFVTNWSTSFRPQHDTVRVFGAASGSVEAILDVGLGPEGLIPSPDGATLYSIGSNTDDIWAIDARALTSNRWLSLHADSAAPKGIQPLMGAISPDGRTLYVASSSDNAIEVIDRETAVARGRIPTEWYPADLAAGPDGETLYVLNARGTGDGSNKESQTDAGDDVTGTLVKIALPPSGVPAAWTREVEDNNRRALGFFDVSGGNDTPIPSEAGGRESPIRYVFWIMKENMSYDAGFGDAEFGNGDPDLTFWTEDVVPNHRKLAREFVLLDAFYCESDNSVGGHTWAEQGAMPDWTHKAVQADGGAAGFAYPTPGFDPGSVPENEAIIPFLLAQGINARSWGVGEQFGPEGFAEYLHAIDTDFPLVATAAYNVPDRTKAQIFIDEFNQFVSEGTVPRFNYLSLPNNHTYGLEIGRPTPASMVADNDEGLGMVIQAIAASPIWRESIILVFEDDTQNGYDHVDAHRSPALIISPWVRRGKVSSVTYSFPSLFATTLRILGSPPLTRFDQLASPMYDAFLAKPDLRSYQMAPRTYPEETYQGPDNALVRMTRSMNWDVLDLADGQAAITWRHLKGTTPPRHRFWIHDWNRAYDGE